MSVGKIVKIALSLGVVALVVYIMVNGIGLVDGLDFGAGAYYYADIPEFDKLSRSDLDFSGSALAVIVFFVVWSIVILGLLKLVKVLPKPSEDDDEDD
ncbi:MAG: hypothetical protein MJZ68_06115 [archaeon]|nr:hypothetical protein [archaeon]